MSCGGDSGSISGPPTSPTDPSLPPTEAPNISASFVSQETTFMPGEFQFIRVEGTELTELEYSALLTGNIETTLIKGNETGDEQLLLFIVPEVNPGNISLSFTLEGQELTLSFQTEEVEEIPDADSYLNDFFTSLTSQKSELLEIAGSPEEDEFIQNLFMDLEQSLETLDEVGDTEKSLLARIIKTYFEEESAASKNFFGFSEENVLTCQTAKSQLRNTTTVTVASLLGLAAGSLMTGSIVLTSLGILVTGTSAAYFGASLMPIMKSIGTFIDICFINEFTTLSLPGSNKVLAGNSGSISFEFDHDQPISFEIVSQKNLDSEFLSLTNELLAAIEPVSDLLPSSWLTALTIEQKTELITENPSIVEMISISDDDIQFEIDAVGQQLEITFYFDEESNPSEPVTFSFTLSDNATYEVTANATLHPPAPVVFNMLFEVSKGSSVQDTLRASFANTFTIIEWPENGDLTLIDHQEGIFTYHPNELFQGEDRFSFSASNNVGESEIAEIELLVQSEICPATYIDPRDGREYDIVELNNRCYFAENLSFPSGNSRCSEDNPANCEVFGRLYNWDDAVNVCPAGTYLPQISEWVDLFNFLGGEDIAGGRMKADEFWPSPNIGRFDSGFNALPGGYINHLEQMAGPGQASVFWTSTYNHEYTWDSRAYSFGFSHNSEKASWDEYSITSSFFSVRCAINILSE